MLANERQDEIYRMIQRDGAVTTAKLVENFNVSLETIRRDLLLMEKENLVRRVHGGAVAVGRVKMFSELLKRNEENGDLKRELAETAAEMVNEQEIIGIDSGSTAIFFAEALKKRFSQLTVITHSADVFEILGKHADFNVILCGGHFLKRENAFYGPLAEEMLSKLHVLKAFIFPTAVSLEGGICDYQTEMYRVQKQMIKAASEVFILADSSKFEKNALIKLSDMKTEYTYITDSLLPLEIKNIYRENNIKILYKERQR